MKAIIKDATLSCLSIGDEVEVLTKLDYIEGFTHKERQNYVWVDDGDGLEQVINTRDLGVIQ